MVLYCVLFLILVATVGRIHEGMPSFVLPEMGESVGLRWFML
jgi:hypothetical protein